jgi:uncharacterized protein
MYCKFSKYFILSLFFLFQAKANAQTNVRQAFVKAVDTTHIVDFEQLYTPTQIVALNKSISNFARNEHIQIGVVTLDTLQVERFNFDNYTLSLAQAWNYNRTDSLPGILIGISKGHRYMRIQNSYAIESVLSDAETKAIIDHYFIPEFKNGNYFEGTQNGIVELIGQLSKSKESTLKKCQYKTTSILKDTTYPFAQADKIVAHSFQPNGQYSTIKRGKFKLKVDETVELTNEQSERLFNILFNLEPIPDTSRVQITRLPARCYIPHHTFVFYKDGKAFEFIEICLRCRNHKTNSGLYVNFCDDAWCELYAFLNTVELATDQDQMEKACE